MIRRVIPEYIINRRFFHQFKIDPISSSDIDLERKHLLRRSRQRGILELDVIVGTFADLHLATMSQFQIQEYTQIMSIESPDLLKLLTRQSAPNESLQNNSVFCQLLQHVSS